MTDRYEEIRKALAMGRRWLTAAIAAQQQETTT
jgi:hypothetical protein